MISLVSNLAASWGANGGTSGSLNTTGANLLVVAISWYSGGTTPTITDSKGNTWTALTQRSSSSTRLKMFYCLAPVVGTGHTFTVSCTGSYPGLAVLAVGGAGVFEVENGANSALQAGSITPAANNEIVIAAISAAGGAITSINAGFTIGPLMNWDVVAGSENEGVALATLIQTTAAAVNPTWTASGGDTAAAIAAFKASTAPTGAVLPVGFEGGMNSGLRGGLHE